MQIHIVLVNIVLAIIVDSFERANEKRHRAKDILTDLATLGTDLRLKLEGQTYSPNDAEAKADALLDAAKPPPGEKERAAPSADPRHHATSKPITLANVDFGEDAIRSLLVDTARDKSTSKSGGTQSSFFAKRNDCTEADASKLARTLVVKRSALERVFEDDAENDDDLAGKLDRLELQNLIRQDQLLERVEDLTALVRKLSTQASRTGTHAPDYAEIETISNLIKSADPTDTAYVDQLRSRRARLISGDFR